MCWLKLLHAMFWWDNKCGFRVTTTGSKYSGHMTILSSLFTSLWRKNFFFFAGLMLDKISPVCTTLFLYCFRCHLPTYSKHKPWLKVWSQHKIPIICSDYLNRSTFLCSKMICSALWSSNRCSMKLLWNAITQMTTRLHLHRSASFKSYSQVWVQEHILSSRSESKNAMHPDTIVHCHVTWGRVYGAVL